MSNRDYDDKVIPYRCPGCGREYTREEILKARTDRAYGQLPPIPVAHRGHGTYPHAYRMYREAMATARGCGL